MMVERGKIYSYANTASEIISIIFAFLLITIFALNWFSSYSVSPSLEMGISIVTIFSLAVHYTIDSYGEILQSIEELNIKIPNSKHLAIWIVCTILAFTTTRIVIMVSTTVFSTQPSPHSLVQGSQFSVVFMLMLAFTGLFIAPIIEEIVFRHYLQKEWLSKISSNLLFRVVTASVLFGVAHIFTYGFGISAIPVISAIALSSMFTGLSYEVTDNLTIPILIHSSENGIAFIALFSIS